MPLDAKPSVRPMSAWAENIMQAKYSHTKPDGSKETWEEIAARTVEHVFSKVPASDEMKTAARRYIEERKFIPGGRYLYASGRPYHNTQNCLTLSVEDSREGWADLAYRACMALMTGSGIGVVYSKIRPEGSAIARTGGTATGPLALAQMINEIGRYVMQGGSRRSAIWAGLVWDHPDIMKWIHAKDWSPAVRAAKAADYNNHAPLDGTNISVLLDDAFFEAYYEEAHEKHQLARDVYWTTTPHMLQTAEPGFSVDIEENAGETLRNAPICAGTKVLTRSGYKDVLNLVGVPSTVWTGKRWAPDVVFKKTANDAKTVMVNFTGSRQLKCDRTHPFLVERYEGAGVKRHLVSIDRVPAALLQEGDILHVSMPETALRTALDVESYMLGFVYGDGTFNKGTADVTFCGSKTELCGRVVNASFRVSSSGLESRGFLRTYFKTDHSFWGGRTHDTFPEELFAADHDEICSFVAGLFDADGNVDATQHRVRLSCNHTGFLRGVARLLEQVGIIAHISMNGHSTYGQKQTHQLVVAASYVTRFMKMMPLQRLKLNDVDTYEPYRDSAVKVMSVTPSENEAVYCADVKFEEHSFQAEGVIISNCCEFVSRDDNNVCNLGSINMANISSIEEMEDVVRVGTAFLLAGTTYSDVPYDAVAVTRTKNRQLGLGLMGVHEWLLKHGKKYEPDADLEEYLMVYESSDVYAAVFARLWNLSVPIKTRAIAPNGTTGIVAETTTGIEPVFCVAYKRRYLKGSDLMYQYVVDPCAARLIEAGVRPEDIEDAYTLAQDVERRVRFQAWMQGFVDHAISSTINLPAWGSELNNEAGVEAFGEMLLKYLPQLRGITCYPDGCRGGQPLSPVDYATAVAAQGEVFKEVVYETVDVCDLTKAGSCD